jgi:hypothetical protein
MNATVAKKFVSFVHCSLLLALTAILTGCMAMPLKKFEPNIAPPELFCDPDAHLSFLQGEGEHSRTFHYVAPNPADVHGNQTTVPTTVEAYYAAVNNSLPPDLQKDKVAVALSKFLTAHSALAQLNAQVADQKRVHSPYLGLDDALVSRETKSIEKLANSPKLTHGDMKRFANKLLGNSRLKPGMSPLTVTPATRFSFYFTADYKGNFYDRMGNLATKPQISLTVSDAEIVGAETVFLEYLIDLLDKTPVLVNDAGNTFYPGGSGTAPTAYKFDPQSAVQIPAGSPTACGITEQNAWLLRDIATGAGTEAATVGGLVTNTWGGLSWGVPILNLKLSFGDNATLSSIVKTAAAEAGMRVSLAAGYWSLRHLKFNVSDPSN